MALVHDFVSVWSEFKKYHTKPLNIGMHIVTSGIGMIAVLGTCNHFFSGNAIVSFVCLYNVTLLHKLPIVLWCVQTLSTHMMVWIVMCTNMTLLCFGIMLTLSVCLQEVAHWITNETTYMSSYSNRSGYAWFITYTNHVYYLLPCILTSCTFDTIPTHVARLT